MEWSAGGSKLEEGLQALQVALQDYYGALNELAMGHPGMNVKIPEKPEALVLYQQCEKLGLPLVSGGLMAQPFIWLQEVAVIVDTKTLYEALSKNSS